MAPKIHADISSRLSADPNGPETPYVVYLHQVELLAENQYIHNAWEFTHPLSVDASARIAEVQASGLTEGYNEHNIRFSRCTFKIPRRGVVHGLGGYFESVLYRDVEMSTRPDTIDAKSKDMISWFPIFFPLKVRMYSAPTEARPLACILGRDLCPFSFYRTRFTSQISPSSMSLCGDLQTTKRFGTSGS